jgi:hypothetical protein
MLPPILVVPFITSFILGVSLSVTRGQWIIGLVASQVISISTGAFLPGPLILPVYGVVFQTRRAKLSGAVSAMVHVIHGVFLAPLIFMVAPAKIVYNWLLAYVGSFVPAILIMTVVFGLGGAIVAGAGYRIGLKLAKNLRREAYNDS